MSELTEMKWQKLGDLVRTVRDAGYFEEEVERTAGKIIMEIAKASWLLEICDITG